MSLKPDDISPLDPTRRVEAGQEQRGAPSRPFEDYMEKAASQSSSAGKPNEVSPFDLIHRQTALAAGPNFDTLLNQVKSAGSMLGDVNNQLNTKNLKLKPSQRYLLRNKLTDANSHLRKANVKMGVDVDRLDEEKEAPNTGGIMGKFLGLISNGQRNIMAAQQKIIDLKSKGENLKPGDFLTLQIQLAHAQQEIEYASIMLSKAVDDMKMMFNIQL